METKVTELASENAKIAELESPPAMKRAYDSKGKGYGLENENANIAELERRPTKEELRTLKAKITVLESENAKISELESRPTKGELAILRAKITGLENLLRIVIVQKEPQDDNSSLASKGQTALPRLDAGRTSVRNDEQSTACTDYRPSIAAEDNDPAQLDAFSVSEEFYEMSASVMQTQFNKEELSLQNMQEKLLKIREKKEEGVKRHTG